MISFTQIAKKQTNLVFIDTCSFEKLLKECIITMEREDW